MKALTVLQPWAQLLMLGAKRYETRSWKSKHRGPLVIHAGRTFSEVARSLCAVEPFRSVLAKAAIRGPGYLARGVLLGAVFLEDCLPTDEVLFDSADAREAAFGDFRPGRWAWRMTTPVWLREPIPIRGKRCIFDVPDGVCSTLMSAMTV
jgi:activating signal cointegrator 1